MKCIFDRRRQAIYIFRTEYLVCLSVDAAADSYLNDWTPSDIQVISIIKRARSKRLNADEKKREG